MKKLVLLCMIGLSVFFLQACAMGPMDQEASFNTPLYFSELTLTFTNTTEVDILYDTGNPTDDFTLLYELYADNPTAEQKVIYRDFMDTLEIVSIASHRDYGYLFNLSSSEIKELYDAESIPFGINEVVIFNEIKDEIAYYKETQSSPRVSKIEYIEFRLNRDLNSEEISNLFFLQDIYNEFKAYNSGFSLKTDSFESLIAYFEAGRFTETEQTNLESAYTLIQSIHQLNE